MVWHSSQVNIKQGDETHANSCFDPVGLPPLRDINSLQLNPIGSLMSETKPWFYQEEGWSRKLVMMSNSWDLGVGDEEKQRLRSGGSIELSPEEFVNNKPLVETNPFLSYMPVTTPPGPGIPD